MGEPRTVQPVGADERILALDVLRGFAMFGVLIAYCLWSLGNAPDGQWSPLDRRLGTLAEFLIDGKFYTILAFLFGLGFAIQLNRAPTDAIAVRAYCRRLVALAAIGLGHALLLRNGDILLPYAVTGFFLIPFRRAPDRLLVGAAMVALLVPYAARWLLATAGIALPERPHLENAPYLVENAAWVLYWYKTAILTWPTNLTLFLFGLLAGRHRLIRRLATQPRRLAVILAGGAAVGVTFFAVSRMSSGSAALPTLAFTLHCWGMSSAYAATLLLLLRSTAGSRAIMPLAAIGRMALTNYLSQAAIIVPLCLALGWFDRFTPSTALLLAGAVFVFIQLPFSLLWLRRFRFGPAEWVWRSLTYGRLPPMRRNAKDSVPS